MAKKIATPNISPLTLGRLNETSNVANKLTNTINKRRKSAIFSGVYGISSPLAIQAINHKRGMIARKRTLFMEGKRKKGEVRIKKRS